VSAEPRPASEPIGCLTAVISTADHEPIRQCSLGLSRTPAVTARVGAQLAGNQQFLCFGRDPTHKSAQDADAACLFDFSAGDPNRRRAGPFDPLITALTSPIERRTHSKLPSQLPKGRSGQHFWRMQPISTSPACYFAGRFNTVDDFSVDSDLPSLSNPPHGSRDSCRPRHQWSEKRMPRQIERRARSA